MRMVHRVRKRGERIVEEDAIWRCCAMESVIRWRDSLRSSLDDKGVVVRGGSSSNTDLAIRGACVGDDMVVLGESFVLVTEKRRASLLFGSRKGDVCTGCFMWMIIGREDATQRKNEWLKYIGRWG